MLMVGVIVALLISFAALAYVLWPLLKPGPAPVIVENDRLTDLVGRKDAVLTAIKELEFDYRMGKLSDEDYQRLDQRLRRQAIGLMQQIEKLAPESAQMDAQIEAEIARLRKTQDVAMPPQPVHQSPPVPAPTSTAPAAPVPAVPAPTAPTPAGTIARYCTNCGHPAGPADKFCANCGLPIPAPAALAEH
jgi:hypothetical protein